MKRMVRAVGTEAGIEIQKIIANIPGQNSCDLSRCHLLLMPSVTARALEGSAGSFPTPLGLESQALDILWPEKSRALVLPFSDRHTWASAPPTLVPVVAKITVTDVSWNFWDCDTE